MSLPINQVLCGDCLEVMKDFPDESIDLIITSPPYNVGKNYATTDELPWSDWYKLIEDFLVESLRLLRRGGTIAVNVLKEARWQRNHKYADSWSDYDPKYETHRGSKRVKGKGRIEPISYRVHSIMETLGFKMREGIIWVKGVESNNDILPISYGYEMGCDSDPYLRGCCEIILLASKGRWFHDGGTGRRGRDAVPYDEFTKDVWVFSGLSNKQHPAIFPEELPKRLIQLFIHRKNTQNLPTPIILDPFVGLGTTCVVAQKLEYNWIGIDRNPDYVDLAKQRIMRECNQKLSKWT